MTVYTIVATSVDLDRGYFPTPEVKGTCISMESAQKILDRLIAAEEQELDDRYDQVERGDDFWEAYQDGEAATCFYRFDILTSELQD